MKERISWHIAAVLLAAFVCASPLAGCKAPAPEATSTPQPSTKATATPTIDTASTEVPSVSKDDLDEMLDSYVLNIRFDISDPETEDVALDIELQHQSEPMRELMDIVGASAEEEQHLKIYNDDDLTAIMDLTAQSAEWEEDESAYWMINTYASIVSMTIDPMVTVAVPAYKGTEAIDGRQAYHYALDEDALRAAMANDDAGIVLTSASCELWVDTQLGVVLKAELQGEGKDHADAEYLVDIVWEVSDINTDLGLMMPDIAEALSQTGDIIPFLSVEAANSFQLQTFVTLTNDDDTLYYEARYDFCQEGPTLVRMFDFSFDEPDGLTTLSIYAEDDNAWISVNGGDYAVADGNYSYVLDYINGWWLVVPAGLVSDALGEVSGTGNINGFDAMYYIADTSTIAEHPDISTAESDGTLEYWISDDATPYLLQVVMNVVATPAVFSKTNTFEIDYESEVLNIDELEDIERPANLPEIETSAETSFVETSSSLMVGGVAPEEFWIDDLVMPEDLNSYRLYQYMFDDSQDSSPDVIMESIEETNCREGERHVALCTRTGSTQWEEYIQTADGTWFCDNDVFETSDVNILDDDSLSDPWIDTDWDLLADEAGTLVGVDKFMGRDACCYAWQIDDFGDVGPVEAVLWVDAYEWTPLLLSITDTSEGLYFRYEYSLTNANETVRIDAPDELPSADAPYFTNDMNLYTTVDTESTWFKLIVKPYELLDTHLGPDDSTQDLVLAVYDSAGNELAWGDDSPENYMPWVVYRPKNAGIVFLEVEVYDQDSAGTFELRQRTFEGSILQDAPELETDSVEGVITANDYVGIEYYNEVCYGHAWYVYLDRGDTIDITCLADMMGSPLDPGVHLLDSEGVALVSDDDSYGDGSSLDSHLVYEIEETGRYYILVQSVNMPPYGDDYTFNLIVDGIN